VAAFGFTAGSLAVGFGRDPVDVNENVYPWSSVGKIYNSARASCTGSVIAPDRVLTAAHCLYNRATRRFLEAGSLHFLLGYKGGEYRTHSRVAGYLVGPDYNPEDANASIRADWAILVLMESTGTTPLLLAQSPSIVGEKVMVGGFSQKYPFKMTADTDCR